ncbi:hypothetical protein C8J57DRAFT_1384030, partial [Mycena rebaudengoi]
YVGAILGLVRVVSLGFNLLYRWHAAFSEEDTAWTENSLNELFEGQISALCIGGRLTLCVSRT